MCDELIAPLAKGINLSETQLQTPWIDEAKEMMSCGEHPEEIEETEETEEIEEIEETEEIITHVEVTELMLRNIIIIKMVEKKLTLV